MANVLFFFFCTSLCSLLFLEVDGLVRRGIFCQILDSTAYISGPQAL